ncbi:dockerin type I domain-containing protein [Paenibacillus silvae]|uniref:dockerin type I domain-containing protein n=1 Tax=Paenibacillus silvae TaxID=1325358 RepID=UPI003CEEC583
MKGKNKRNTLKPIMKKSMLAALGLGIALPVAGSLPQVQAGAIGPSLEISRPVLNEGISWLNVSSEQSNGQPIMPSVPIVVEQSNLITIDLSSHFPSGQFSSISAKSSNYDIASVDVSVDHSTYKLVVVPFASGIVNIELTAQYNASQEPNSQSETITDNIELYISKKGDFNNDGYVDSADAVELFNYLRNIQFGRSISFVDMNKADIDRNGVPDKTNDMSAFMQGYIGGTLGAKDSSYVLTFKQKRDEPQAFNAVIKGQNYYQETISSDVQVLDVDTGENMHLNYQWFNSESPTGENMQEISGATDSSYNIQIGDIEKYLILKVTPVVGPNDPPAKSFTIITKTPVPKLT